ncbi:fatty acid desaturase [Cupriavidus taiwanensis]|uniref:Fatty acid desaturase domain-containing protein n=1 Tax=Cupriavidus taiwanensis (strain DSM 17343 / BCRC 17206 / CCUG 44338 / CIP 107171 / LMG 19424 / R1) TaxID=977880 RepID=B3RBG4_CUPTR|nr:fatty acid desaturase [Cupriavidus taiwanensis]CAQ72239.1 hypothetical protein RALTA_B1644 [Cupriavidus taiwanensis LMG 19424]
MPKTRSILQRAARICIAAGDRAEQRHVRESMRDAGSFLPGPLYRTVQRFLTWLTGKALPGQQPAILLGPWSHVALNTLALTTGVALSCLAYARGGAWWLALLPGWLLTVHAARKFFLVICHGGIHEAFSRRASVNRMFVDVVSLLLLTLPYEQFRQDHAIDHHARYFSGKGDPDADVLYGIGLRPGRQLETLWLAVGWALVNPRFHLRYTLARGRANFVGALPLRRMAAILAYAAAGCALTWFNLWPVFLVVWAIPLTVGFQNAALLTFAGEHKWFRVQGADERRAAWLQQQTSARFMGCPYPCRCGSAVRHVLQRAGWWLRMLCWFLPLRLLVVPGDMPVHDYHHSNPRGDWTNTLYVRPEWIAQNRPLHSETWGFCAAVNNALRPMSEIPVDYLAHGGAPIAASEPTFDSFTAL